MQKRIIIFVLAVIVAGGLSWPCNSAAAERGDQPLLVAVLLFSGNNLPVLDGLKAGLRQRGYAEGQRIKFVFNGPVERHEDLEPEMTRLMAVKPDLVFAAPTPAVQVAQKMCRERNIPVLFGPVNDAIGAGLIKDRKHPGGNITGVMLSASEGKRLEWATEIVPGIKNVLVPYNPTDKSAMISFVHVQEAADDLGLRLIPKIVRNRGEVDALLTQFPEGIDLIFLLRDVVVVTRIKDFAELALKKKLALSPPRIDLLELGALYSFGFDGFELGKQIARMAEQIFAGIKPGDLPLETAEDYLAINLKTAKAIGLPVNPRLLRLAYRVIRPE